MHAMLLGAGRGTRLGALSRDVPKILAPIGAEPLLAHQLRFLAAGGITDVVLNTHHLAEQVEAFASKYRGPIRLSTIFEPELLGTAGAVRNAVDRLGPAPFLIMYGDVIADCLIAPMMQTHKASSAEMTLAVYPSVDTLGKGVVTTDHDGLATSFIEKGGCAPGLVNAGLYVACPAFIRTLDRGHFLDFGTDVLPGAISGGIRIATHQLAKPVLDIGTPEALQSASRQATAGPT